MIRAWKFGGRRSLVEPLASAIAALVPPGDELLVPVPSRPGSCRKRGFDPVRTLVTRVSVIAGRSWTDLLVNTGRHDQKTLSLEERREFVHGRFRLKVPREAVPESIALIDDVFTTGATLSECASVLLDAGAKRVHCVTLVMEA